DVHLYGKGWAPSLLEGMELPVTVRGRQRLAVGQLRALRAGMRARHPGRVPGALLFTRSFSSAVETRLAGFRPVGYAYDGRRPFLHEAYPRPAGLHAGEEYWRIVNAFLREELPFPSSLGFAPSPRQMEAARALLAQAGVAGDYVVLCPFSGSDDREDRKVWPGFPALAERLRAQGRRGRRRAAAGRCRRGACGGRGARAAAALRPRGRPGPRGRGPGGRPAPGGGAGPRRRAPPPRVLCGSHLWGGLAKDGSRH